MLIISAGASLVLLVILLAFAGSMSALQTVAFILIWIVTFQTYIAIECVLIVRTIKRIRMETLAESDPNDSPIKAHFARRVTSKWEGRVYRSSTTLLGLPLLDIHVSSASPVGTHPQLKRACGWIAFGDRADGILLAVGGIARGFFAFGGLSIGVVSGGGLALGVLAIGGLAIGAIALGGLGIGGLAFGGGAIGWQAVGGGALAWDIACGGGAAAWHAAYGGAAIANDIALGGAVSAVHANDEVARAFFADHWMVNGIQWLQVNNWWVTPAWILLMLLPSALAVPVMYRRKTSNV